MGTLIIECVKIDEAEGAGMGRASKGNRYNFVWVDSLIIVLLIVLMWEYRVEIKGDPDGNGPQLIFFSTLSSSSSSYSTISQIAVIRRPWTRSCSCFRYI
jgi:hypothetical protein